MNFSLSQIWVGDIYKSESTTLEYLGIDFRSIRWCVFDFLSEIIQFLFHCNISSHIAVSRNNKKEVTIHELSDILLSSSREYDFSPCFIRIEQYRTTHERRIAYLRGREREQRTCVGNSLIPSSFSAL
jgi:hypothetical protein